MHLKLICPSKSRVWDEAPKNEGFRRDDVVRSLDELQARAHDYEVIDGDAISDAERRELYGHAYVALVTNGNRYRIRQVFGNRRRGCGDFLGTVPALILSKCGEPIDVYPQQVGDGYATIPGYLDTL